MNADRQVIGEPRRGTRLAKASASLRGALPPSIRFSFIVALVALCVAFVGATALSQYRYLSIDPPAQRIATNAGPSIVHLSDARDELRQLELLAERFAEAPPSKREEVALTMRAVRGKLDNAITAYLELPYFPGERQQWFQVEKDLQRVDADITSLLAAAIARTPDLRASIAEHLDPDADATLAAMHTAIDLNAVESEKLAHQISAARHQATTLALVLTGLAVLAVLAAGSILFRSVRAYAQLTDEHRELLARQATALEEFSERVAHDILGPLSTVGLSLDVAERQAESSLATVLAPARASLQRVRLLVDDLLEFARAGGQPTPGARVDVSSCARDIVYELTPTAEAADVRLHLEAPTYQLTAACLPGVLASILVNLVRNAIKYTVGQPVREVSVRIFGNNAVHIEVEDTGPGIAAELQTVIFEPYTRVPNTSQPGLGLGLATVKRLAEAYGGAVGVRTTAKGGSLFGVRLPRA